MNNDSPKKALLMIFVTALACSILVSVAAISLRPIQLTHKLLERARNVIQLTGLVSAEQNNELSDEALLTLYGQLDKRVVNIDEQIFAPDINPETFDQRKAANDAERSVDISAEFDIASLGRRSRYAMVYIVWQEDQLKRIILPMHGQGMWSTIYGYIALGPDLNTIEGVSFYEQAETPGLGDQILRPEWQAQWLGRKLLDTTGSLRFRIASGSVNPDSPTAAYEVDALSGASVTANGVNGLVGYWFGDHGFQPFLQQLRSTPPVKVTANNDVTENEVTANNNGE